MGSVLGKAPRGRAGTTSERVFSAGPGERVADGLCNPEPQTFAVGSGGPAVLGVSFPPVISGLGGGKDAASDGGRREGRVLLAGPVSPSVHFDR